MSIVDTKQSIRHAFANAAKTYDEAAFLHREVGERLWERLDYIRHQPQSILDLGCNTGYYTHQLRKRYRSAKVYGLDIAFAMVKQTYASARRFHKPALVNADAERLPFADNSMDMIFSNLVLQWIPNLKQCFQEIKRVLAPKGLLLFSTYGPDTLKELRHAWATVDDNPHVNDFVDMHDVGDAMLASGLHDPVMDMDMLTVTYASPQHLFRELRALGARNCHPQRSRSLTGKVAFQTMLHAYQRHANEHGEIPASYEIVCGHAWGAQETLANTPQNFHISLDNVKKTLSGKS